MSLVCILSPELAGGLGDTVFPRKHSFHIYFFLREPKGLFLAIVIFIPSSETPVQIGLYMRSVIT